MLKLVLAERADERRLSDALQTYLREMSRYYDETPDENGVFPYPYLPLYFEEAARQAYLFYEEGRWIGFALVNDHSFTGAPVDHSLAEFTVFPAYRGMGYAADAVKQLFARYPGRWHLKYSVKNGTGMRFWKRVTAPYAPSEQALNADERLLTFKVSNDEI